MKKAIFAGIILFCCYILQTTLFALFNIGGIRPNLLIIVTASLGFLGGQKTGIYTGFFSGLLVDICLRTVYGANALLYMYVGYSCGCLKKVLYPKDIKLPLLFIAGSDLAYNILFYFLNFLFRGRFEFLYYFRHIILPEVVYTSIMACILYPFIHFIMMRIEVSEKKGEQTID
ncbi:MAG: rod shape-determining protein MreD [Lachnospiraceae bacterium]|nr:rod shape-determining protein MreD [Lachnospiraceae bacterium]